MDQSIKNFSTKFKKTPHHHKGKPVTDAHLSTGAQPGFCQGGKGSNPKLKSVCVHRRGLGGELPAFGGYEVRGLHYYLQFFAKKNSHFNDILRVCRAI